MGVLNARGITGVDEDPGEPAPSPEPEAPEPKPEAPAEPSKGEFVPYSAVEQARKPGSRRAKAAQEVEEIVRNQLKPLQDEWGTQRQTYEQRIQQQAQELAEMRGRLETMQRMPPPAPAPAPAPGPDPEKLLEEAQSALDNRDIRGYHQKLMAAHQAQARKIAEEQIATVRKDLESRIPAPIPPDVQFLMASHKNVAMAGQQGVQAVMLKEKELEFYRHPPGPQRLAKAFELADKFLASVNGQTNGSSQKNTQAQVALSAVPTSRPAGGSGGKADEGVHLTPLQMETIKNLGWSKEEYVKWMNPEKFVRR